MLLTGLACVLYVIAECCLTAVPVTPQRHRHASYPPLDVCARVDSRVSEADAAASPAIGESAMDPDLNESQSSIALTPPSKPNLFADAAQGDVAVAAKKVVYLQPELLALEVVTPEADDVVGEI